MLELTQAIVFPQEEVKPMPTWEETKRAGQTAFIMTGNGFEDIHSSVANAYQQILLTGHLNPIMDRPGMDQIGIEPEHTSLEKAQPEQEQDLEPER